MRGVTTQRAFLVCLLALCTRAAMAAQPITGALGLQPPHKLSAEDFIAIGTWVLAAATTFLWIATYKLHKGAESSSEQQRQQMAEQLKAATESNNALRAVAEAQTRNTDLMSKMMSAQFRAHITAEFGLYTYQDERNHFAAEALLRNRGLSPAKHVCYWACARILDAKNPDLKKPTDINIVQNDAVITPNQDYKIFAYEPIRFEDKQVKEILDGSKKRLFMWGQITYKDIYDVERVTNFCHSIYFAPAADGKGWNPYPQLHQSHNNAT